MSAVILGVVMLSVECSYQSDQKIEKITQNLKMSLKLK
jgi:hypothetical protein